MGIHQNFIGGRWTEASTAAPNVNPSNTRDIVGEYARGTKGDANRAIEMAKAAFPMWSRSSASIPGLAQTPQKAIATFINTQGEQIGTANLLQTSQGVLIEAEVRGLPPGEHAFHIHQKGACDPATKFESAGGHFALSGEKHGFLAEGGPHAGDMPNQFVGPDGVLRIHVLDPNVTLEMGDGSVFGADGTSIVIHAKADDYSSQPAGNAGDRIACGVIKHQ
jgi:superoxide dismutase, Cu-Zn family